MAKPKTTRKPAKTTNEPDGTYLLKLVLYIVIGAQWLWIGTSNGNRLPIPVGLVIGLLFVMHDHFKIDRKIEYAVLLVATLFGYIAAVGIFIN